MGISRSGVIAVALVTAALAAAACSTPAAATPTLAPTPTPALTATITQAQAIDAALAQAKGDQITASLEEPRNPHAELMTLAAAYQQLAMQPLDAPGQTQNGPAWLVTLEGSWQSATTSAPAAATAAPYHHYWVVLDANTGQLITYTVGP